MTHDWGSDISAFLAWRKANPISEEDKAFWRDHHARHASAPERRDPVGVHGSGNVKSEVEYVRGTGMDPSFGLYPQDRIQ